MNQDYRFLLETSKKKAMEAIALVEASLLDLSPYNSDKSYTPKEREVYDALSDRYMRAVEICIKFFRTYEYYLFTAPSDTFRDLLLNMEKQKMISSIDIWIDMRDLRNRIVHDYLPDQVKSMYDLMMGNFRDELMLVKKNIDAVTYR
jgi:uncharacterized protein YutE (UPF0331/DUF86 family)